MVAASSSLSLHTQDLIDVMVELERSDSRVSRHLYRLAEGGLLYPLDEKVLGPIRKEGQIFFHSEWAAPVLTGELPLFDLPNAGQIKNILMKEIGGENMYHFVPTRGTPELDARAVFDLLDNIGNTKYNMSGAIVNMQSPTFERLCEHKVDWPNDGILGVSQVLMTVTPVNNVQDMEYYACYTSHTLLQGTKVWLTYPPHPENFAALRAPYEALTTDGDALGLDHALDFRHGILIVQQAGQNLWLPPFWTATVISTQAAVSATYCAAIASTFGERIKYLSEFRLTTQLGLSSEAHDQDRLILFASELVDHLQRILEDSFPHCKVSIVITNICRDNETLRAGLRQVLQVIDDKTVTQGIESKYRAAWLNFLEEKRKKDPGCRLCNMRIQNMPAGGFPADRLRQHFIDFHCLRSELVVQPVSRK